MSRSAKHRDKTWIDTCFICNKLSEVSKHYNYAMCHKDYHLVQRMRKLNPDWTLDELITKAVSRREELQGTGKWEKRLEKNPLQNIRIGILK